MSTLQQEHLKVEQLQHASPDDLEVAAGRERENLEGWIPALATEAEIREALEKAFDYRGDITITLIGGTISGGTDGGTGIFLSGGKDNLIDNEGGTITAQSRCPVRVCTTHSHRAKSPISSRTGPTATQRSRPCLPRTAAPACRSIFIMRPARTTAWCCRKF